VNFISLFSRTHRKPSEGTRLSEEPMMVEVVSYMLTMETVDCHNCRPIFKDIPQQCRFHEQDMREYPEDIKEQVIRLSDWVLALCQRYPDRIQVKVIDALSPQGLYKKIRHRLKGYPGFIVDHQETYWGWDKDALEAIIERHLERRSEVMRAQPVGAES
jgi:hypothetical protein